MDNYIYILSKQENLIVERFHICIWTIEGHAFFTEYGLEIHRGALKKVELQMALPLPKQLDNKNFISLYENIIDSENCRFIFNADIKDISPINGKSSFGTRIEFQGDRKITALPIEFDDDVKVSAKTNTLDITIDTSNEQISETIYIRFLIKTDQPAFIYEKKEITRRIITNEVRVNECRTASKSVIKLLKESYKPVVINKCFCFHIIPNSYSIDFIDNKKLKTIRSLEASGFSSYLGALGNVLQITLKEYDYNIVFCKQEKKAEEKIRSYSFFSRYNKEYIGNTQIGIAILANILCSLLFAIGTVHHQIDYEQPFFCRIAWEYYVALLVIVVLVIYLSYCRCQKKI